MSKKHVQWLYEELLTLVNQGVVSAETAERLYRHYGEKEQYSGRRWAVVLFGILGAALIGGGVILLLSHNWDQLSKPARTVLSFAPLMIAQVLAGFVLLRRSDSTAWRESVGAGWALAIGASIALVAQTYNISGDFGRFMLTWTLLGLAAVYLLQACLPAMLYLIGITVWTGHARWSHAHPAWFWLLAALLLPYVWRLFCKNRYQPRMALVNGVFAVCLCIATGFTLEWNTPGLWILVYSAMLALLYSVGVRWFGDAPIFSRPPLQTVGGIGVIVLSLILTFEEPWLGYMHSYGRDLSHSLAGSPSELAVWVGLPILATLLCCWCVRHGKAWHMIFGALPAVATLGQFLAGTHTGTLAATVVFDVYLVALGVTTMIVGLRSERLSIVNIGMGILALLIITRFFDSELSFVARGLAFIAVGCAFLITNIVLTRRKGAVR
jgi:uncharacterized membrane protein